MLTAAGPSLALATAAGSLKIVNINQDAHQQLVTEQTCFEDAMAASVAFSRRDEGASGQLAASSSGGELASIKVEVSR